MRAASGAAAARDQRPGFARNELFETLLRIRRDEPRRYAAEVGDGLRRRVELYELQKARARSRSRSAA